VLLALAAWVGTAWALDLYGRTREPEGRFDAIVVAGAHVRHDHTPSGSLERRTRRAVELWRAERAPKIVFTGGPRKGLPPEARIAADLARSLGVPDSAIEIEDRSSSTLENAQEARSLLGDVSVLVVTDTYHVLRTARVFDEQFSRAAVVGVSHSWHPQLRLALREVGALGWYLLSGH